MDVIDLQHGSDCSRELLDVFVSQVLAGDQALLKEEHLECFDSFSRCSGKLVDFVFGLDLKTAPGDFVLEVVILVAQHQRQVVATRHVRRAFLDAFDTTESQSVTRTPLG
jgi:hypothetical protein